MKWQEITGEYKNNFTNTADLIFDYKYDKSNRHLETEYANSQNPDDFKLENKYDKDGNILELKRYNGSGNLIDNFNYTYISGTNKLQKVTGTVTQYTYDGNGNMKTDNLNRNRDIKYDHRNLITQLTHKQIVFEDSLLYSTYYYYDESGNRIRKKVYQYTGIQPADSVISPDVENIGDSPGLWNLVKDEVYSRTADGRELVLYVNGSLKQSNIWGIGNEGYLTSADEPYFYLKDHLGSIRALTNDKNEIISGQDYDAWGYLHQGRQYDSDESVYKFTGKERDEENLYDYFSARNYNSRIGRFNSFEPIPSSSFGWSGYVYCADNPLRIIDPTGEEWYYIYDDERSGNWQYYKDEAWKEIWNGRYDESGNKIMESKQGYNELLFFQGSELQWLMENGDVKRWAAVSGLVDEKFRTQPELQIEENKGPTPEGWWTVDPQDGHSSKEAVFPWEVANWLRKYVGQGEAFFNIYPTLGNSSNRVSGFSIHGGLNPVSIGCIDLMLGMGSFYSAFKEHNKSMLLNVNYSNFK